MSTPKHTCSVCGKTQRSRNLWLRHMLWCEYLASSSKSSHSHHNNEEEEATPLPSLRDVLSLVAQLQEQVRVLETRLAACERARPHGMGSLSQTRKGHAHITAWLNETWPHPSFPYSETPTMSSLSLNQEDMACLADKSFSACLERVLPRSKDIPGNPLVSLQWPWPPPKRPVLYWYDANATTWKEWTREELVAWLDKLQRFWLACLCGWWKQTAATLSVESDEYEQRQQVYNKAMMHLMVSFKEDVMYHRARHVLVAQLLRQVPETDVA